MITVRLATADDAELVADMSRETFLDAFGPFNSGEDMDQFMTGPFSRESLTKEVKSPGSTFLLAYDNNEPAGYARMRISAVPEELGKARAIEIARIYATKASIGRGIGKELMKTCIDIAIEGGYDVIWLGVWEENRRAIDFYKKWGFERFSQHPFVLGKDV